MVVSDGFHKTQRLRRGRSNVVHPSLTEPADGGALVGGHEFPMEPAQDEGGTADSAAFSGSINAEGKIALPALIFTVLPPLGTVFHFDANRILEEIPQR